MLLNYLVNSITNLNFVFFIKILLLFENIRRQSKQQFLNHIHRKTVFFLCKTLPIENSLFHPHLFCVTFAPTEKAGIAQPVVKKKIVHLLRFSRGMQLQSWHLHHHAITTLLHWKLAKTVTTDRFPQRLVHQSYQSPTFQTFRAAMKDYHLSWLNKSCEAESL